MSILCVGAAATAISLSVPAIYGIFILAADIVYVVVLPQLTFALFLAERGSGVGAVAGFLVGAVMRVGAGEASVGLPPFIDYHSPWGSPWFPFRTTAMLCSALAILLVSEVARVVRPRTKCCRGDGQESNASVVKVSRKIPGAESGEGEGGRTVFSNQEMSLLSPAGGEVSLRHNGVT